MDARTAKPDATAHGSLNNQDRDGHSPAAGGRNNRSFGMVLPIVLFSYFLILLNNSIVFTSNHAIATDLGMDNVTVSWVSNAYGLTFGGFLLLSGRLGDLFGRRRLLLDGLLLFSVTSLLVGVAPNAGFLIVMRALQGIGAAMLTPATLALLLDTYEGEMQVRAVAYYGTVAGIGGAMGMVVGGIIANFASWRYGFYLDVPIGLALAAMTARYVKRDSNLDHGRVDWAGSILSVIGFSALVYAISGRTGRLPAGIIAVVLLVGFIIVEQRTAQPVVPLYLLLDSGRGGAYIVRFMLWGASMSYFFMIPAAMQNNLGFSPLLSAIAFLPLSAAQFTAAMLVPRVLTRLSAPRTIVLGSVIIVAGYLAGWLIGMRSGYLPGVFIPMLLIGTGQGLAVTPLTSAGVEGAKPEDAGAASGVVNVAAQIGGAVGLALVSTNVADLTDSISPLYAQRDMMVLMAVGGIIGIIAFAVQAMQHRAISESE